MATLDLRKNLGISPATWTVSAKLIHSKPRANMERLNSQSQPAFEKIVNLLSDKKGIRTGTTGQSENNNSETKTRY